MINKIRNLFGLNILKKSRGLAQIPLMIGLLLMAIAVPAVTKLVQQNQANQGKAACNDSGEHGCSSCCRQGPATYGGNCVCYAAINNSPYPTAVPTNRCTPSCGCAGSTYIGQTCDNNCGGRCNGTKPLPATLAPCGSANTSCCSTGNKCNSGLFCNTSGMCTATAVSTQIPSATPTNVPTNRPCGTVAHQSWQCVGTTQIKQCVNGTFAAAITCSTNTQCTTSAAGLAACTAGPACNATVGCMTVNGSCCAGLIKTATSGSACSSGFTCLAPSPTPTKTPCASGLYCSGSTITGGTLCYNASGTAQYCCAKGSTISAGKCVTPDCTLSSSSIKCINASSYQACNTQTKTWGSAVSSCQAGMSCTTVNGVDLCRANASPTPTIAGDCGQLYQRHDACGCSVGLQCASGECVGGTCTRAPAGDCTLSSSSIKCIDSSNYRACNTQTRAWGSAVSACQAGMACTTVGGVDLCRAKPSLTPTIAGDCGQLNNRRDGCTCSTLLPLQCASGECVGGVCTRAPAGDCTLATSSMKCIDSSSYRTCNTQTRAWSGVTSACQAGMSCTTVGGVDLCRANTSATPTSTSASCVGNGQQCLTIDKTCCVSSQVCQYSPYGYFCAAKPATSCTAGQTKCSKESDGLYYTAVCTSTGVWNSKQSVCDGGCTSLDTVGGTCKSYCTPGRKECQLAGGVSAVATCNATGTAWSRTSCITGTTCDTTSNTCKAVPTGTCIARGGQCLSMNNTCCGGATTQVCQYSPYGYFCADKPATACTPGTTKCYADSASSATAYYTAICTANGVWDYKQSRCDGGCSGTIDTVGSTCKGICTPGDTKCDFAGGVSAIATCNSTGTAWGRTSCLTGQTCDQNTRTCKTTIVTTTSTPLASATPTRGSSNGSTSTPVPTSILTSIPTSVVGRCTQCSNLPGAKAKGDADCSGDTTINDYQNWIDEYKAGNLGTVSKNTWKADFDCSGTVDINDYQIWIDNFKKGN